NAGDVYAVVDRPERALDLGNHGIDRGTVAHVERAGLAAEIGDGRDVEVCRDDAGAFLKQLPDHSAPDAAGSAGDEGELSRNSRWFHQRLSVSSRFFSAGTIIAVASGEVSCECLNGTSITRSAAACSFHNSETRLVP